MAKPDLDVSSPSRNADVDLLDIWNALVRDRWIVIILSVLGLGGAAFYAWHTPSVYRAEAVLLPQESNSRSPLGSQLASLGGLASLAGVALGSSTKNEPIAILRSRDFARGFLVEEKLVDVVCDLAGVKRDVDMAVDVFVSRIRFVREDQKTGLVTLSVDWADAVTAADFVNRMAARINRISKATMVSEASASIEYLRGQVAEGQETSLRQAIGRTLDSELQKLLLAKGREEVAFRIIDTARPPVRRHWPRRRLLLAAGLIGGFMLALAVVFVRSASRRHRR